MHVNIQAKPKTKNTNDIFDTFRCKYGGFRYSVGECRITEIPATSPYFSKEVRYCCLFLSLPLLSNIKSHPDDFLTLEELYSGDFCSWSCLWKHALWIHTRNPNNYVYILVFHYQTWIKTIFHQWIDCILQYSILISAVFW